MAAALGGIDIVVANVSGMASGDAPADWARQFAVDVMATKTLDDAALPFLERSDAGAIVAISNLSAMRVDAPDDYSALKAPLPPSAQGLNRALPPQGLRAHPLSPGPLHSEHR